VKNDQLDEGRLLDEHDEMARNRVAVVGSFVATRLNAGFSMVGETIWIGGIPFDVVGQLKGKGFSTDGQNEDDQILIPLETARRRLFNVDYLSRLLVQVDELPQMGAVQAQTREILRKDHELDKDVKDDFNILSMIRSNEIRRMNSSFLEGLSQIFTMITLAIGGAGVLAVTFLNVKDRTWEIGLRMAIGARSRDILSQFLVESILLCALGGATGILLGRFSSLVVRATLLWPTRISWPAMFAAVGVSLLIGVVFGYYPAWKASRLDPIEALRYE
jgi:putative ABC transport system permease protein